VNAKVRATNPLGMPDHYASAISLLLAKENQFIANEYVTMLKLFREFC
jgi:hypothetical protein